jgi:23S rRNA pseudouridine1911/1915/1917 synthase
VQGKPLPYELQWIVQPGEEGLLKHFLLKHKQMSRRRVAKIKMEGEMRVNGERVRVNKPVEAGDKVEVLLSNRDKSTYILPESMQLNIVYEDEHLIVLCKSPGICVHPTYGQKTGTLANGVMHHWLEKGLLRSYHAVNRLDRDTSGIVVGATNPFTHHRMALLQRHKKIERRYYAWVEGNVEQEEGVIDAPIGRDPTSFVQRMVREDGKQAVTKYRVLQRFAGYTWLDVQLATGRTHQIRVHFSHVGHPLLGDTMYGGNTLLSPRQALHAYKMCFIHPHTDEPLHLQAPVPDDLRRFLSAAPNAITKTSPNGISQE